MSEAALAPAAVTQVSNAVRMMGVGKRYKKIEEHPTLIRSLVPFRRPPRGDLWALRDVDLEVAEGEVVGLIGSNGAGKTTLLRMLAGVTRPTEGVVEVRGRIAPLLSLGIGFQREMSGRENISLNGMLLGLSQAQVRERFDDIVAFAELADFIDVPVKFYSSGMYVRLGFAIAVHTDPRVLLVDEVLSVGDSAFQLKCLKRLDQIRASGATVLMVSHQLAAIQQLCPRAVVLSHGRVEFDGETDSAIAVHHELMAAASAAGGGNDLTDPHRHQFVGGARILDRQLFQDGEETRSVVPEARLRYRVRLAFDRAIDSPGVQFRLAGPEGGMIYARNTPLNHDWRRFEAGEEVDVELEFQALLGHGTHHLRFVAYSGDVRQTLVTDDEGLAFYVQPQPDRWGIIDLGGSICVDGRPVDAAAQPAG